MRGERARQLGQSVNAAANPAGEDVAKALATPATASSNRDHKS